MSHRMGTELVINALKMAYYKIHPTQEVILHSDQGAQFSSYTWQMALKTYHIKLSMSQRGNCYDNAVVGSFFKTLKKEAVKKQYSSRERKLNQHYLLILRCFIIQKEGTVIWVIFLLSSLKKDIIKN